MGVIAKSPSRHQALFMQGPSAPSHVRMSPKELGEGALLKFSFCDGQNGPGFLQCRRTVLFGRGESPGLLQAREKAATMS